MTNRLSICFIALVALTSVVGCNEKSETADIQYTSTMVKSFSLKANEDVLSALDSVFFSIDLESGLIFNADSLPYGTNVKRLPVNIATDYCSVIELHEPVGGKVIDYTTNSTDSVDFSNGPVTLHLVSYDGLCSRDYSISVNVHKIVPDSLWWNKLARRNLPTALASAPKAQRTVKTGSTILCLTADGSTYSVATTTDPMADDWSERIVTFPFTPELGSLVATANAVYMLSDTGALYRSTDFGTSWQPTGKSFTSLIGGYGNEVLGVRSTASGYECDSYPTSRPKALPSDFPVSGASVPVEVATEWSETPQIIIVGGRKADGSLTNAVWGYDGSDWACFGERLPKKLEGMTVVPYTITMTDTLSWRSKKVPALIAMGGRDDAALSRKVYISRDFGINWKTGDDLLQWPVYIASRYDAQAYVVETTHYAGDTRSVSSWSTYGSVELPRWWSIDPTVGSRATAPVSEWQTPYIYMFGGIDAPGHLCDDIWRGVINRLTFKPLQ